MNSVLAQIQHDAQQFSEAIAGIIDCDVEVVDVGMVRVAGTGAFRQRVNENMGSQGYVYRHAMQVNRTILIENPGQSAICTLCDNKLLCEEMLDLATPISLDGAVIGVIGIICSTPRQRDHLLAGKDKYISFIEQIAQLIAGKAYEYRERQREKDTFAVFRRMIETMNHGVVALDGNGIVWHANQSAARLLQRPDDLVGRRLSVELSGDVLYDFEEAWLDLGTFRLHVLCTRIRLTTVERGEVTLIVFQDAADYMAPSGMLPPENLSPDRFIGDSPAIRQVRALIDKIAAGKATVLITGESGTGKEVVAAEIHRRSPRRDAPFVTINCASIPEPLLESELFGYVKGAFTGADPKGRVGKFEQANGGTIFLDEIGDMPVYLQAKLLRVLQERVVTRVGSNQAIPIDVRLITATNKDLIALIADKQFRDDLYYRINVIELTLPSLRERREDIAELTQHFCDEFAGGYGQTRTKLPEELTNALYFYDWPGNVRELRNVVEHLFVMRGEAPDFNLSHLPRRIQPQRGARPGAAPSARPAAVRRDEAARLVELLERHGWDVEGKKRTAQALDIGIATLYRRLAKHGLNKR